MRGSNTHKERERQRDVFFYFFPLFNQCQKTVSFAGFEFYTAAILP